MRSYFQRHLEEALEMLEEMGDSPVEGDGDVSEHAWGFLRVTPPLDALISE